MTKRQPRLTTHRPAGLGVQRAVIYLDPAFGDIDIQRDMAERECLEGGYTPILTVTEHNHWWARHELARLLRVHDLYDAIVIPQIQSLGQELRSVLEMLAMSSETGRRFIIPGIGDLTTPSGKFYVNTSAAFMQHQRDTAGPTRTRTYIAPERRCATPGALSGILRCEVCALDMMVIDDGQQYVCPAGCLVVEANDVERRVLEFTRHLDASGPCRSCHCLRGL